jgi:hypothetical protein
MVGSSVGQQEVELFVQPSREARWLAQTFPWLIAPPDGRQRWYTRLLGFVVVAPFTQFTVASFDLQLFLFQVFHTRRWARVGHAVFMPAVNFFVMVALAQLRLGPHPTGHGWAGPSVNGATVYALLLLAWYLMVAVQERLLLWWSLTVPPTLALAFGADAYYCRFFVLDPAQRSFLAPTVAAASPYLWMYASAQMIMLSHVPEPLLPPRVTDAWRWTSVKDFVLGGDGACRSVPRVIGRGLLLLVQVVSGALNEWWASPRLMPYSLLVLMFRLGYQPERARRARSYADRAIASGNPAVDFVGIGGGAFLRPDDVRGGAR